jgi:anti-sigma-K factor RskA
MTIYSDDHIALAAEYALGTLDADERALVETMMIVDTGFLAVVESWDRKLAPLHEMVGSVEPPSDLWEKIKTATGLPEQRVPTVLPESESEKPMSESNETSSEASGEMQSVVAAANEDVAAKPPRQRPSAGYMFGWLMTAIAACLAAIIGLQSYHPTLLPEGLRIKPKIVEVKTPAPTQLIGVMQRGAYEPAFILTVDKQTRGLTVRRVGASPEPGADKSYELWIVSSKLPKPGSLGVIGESDFVTLNSLSKFDTDIVDNATYAVTLEQKGGSPSGAPTVNPLWAGKLFANTQAASAQKP